MKNILIFMICLSVVKDVFSSELKPAEKKKIALEKYAQEVFFINYDARVAYNSYTAEIDRLVKESNFRGHRNVAEEVFKKYLQVTMSQKAGAVISQSRHVDPSARSVKRVAVRRVFQPGPDQGDLLPYKLEQGCSLPYNFEQHMLSIARVVEADAKRGSSANLLIKARALSV